jgi:TRAP-type transport system small permease protein
MGALMRRFCRLSEGLMALMLATMVVLVFGNVVLRYGFNSGITVSEEVSRWLFVWMTFLGATVALHEAGHLGTDMLVSRLPAWGKRLCLIVSQIAMLYITWLMFKGSWDQTQINLDVQAPVTGLSVAWFYSAGVVFAVSSGLILVGDLWRTVTGQIKDSELVMVKESEDLAQIDELHLTQSQTFKR